MRHIISIYLPRGAAARTRLRPTPASSPSTERAEAQPLALTTAVKNVQQLAAVNEAARAAGLSPSMTLTHARALLPDLLTAPADPDADRIRLEKLADWCGRYSPSFGIDRYEGLWGDTWFSADDGLWIDVTGCAHLFGGEQALLVDLEHRLNDYGIRHSLGMAETLGAAWALARYSPGRIVDPGNLGASNIGKCLGDLPVAGLRLLPETVTLLKRLGLKTIGQLETLPRSALGKRFSSKEAGEAVLLRLDQAFGRQDEPLCPRHPPPIYRTEQAFLEPIIELPGLVHALNHLTSELCRLLNRAGLGVERLALLAFRVDGDVKTLRVGASKATHDADHIGRLFTERLETIDPGFGIEKLALHAERTAPLGARQGVLTGGLMDEADQDERLAQLIDRLANRLGPGAVTVSIPQESHIPEHADRHISAMRRGRECAAPGYAYVKAAGPPCRPSCLLLRPEPIKALAEVPDGPPLRFTWRRVTRRIVKAEGPERIAPSWVGAADGVDLASETRDYYRVEDEQGQRYWLFRKGLYGGAGHQVTAVGRADWFVHGLFG